MSDFKVVQLLNPVQINLPGTITYLGAYSGATDYTVGDSVDYQGSSYVMYSDAAAGTAPTDTDYWQVLAEKGDDGAAGPQGPQGPQGPAGGGLDEAAHDLLDHTGLTGVLALGTSAGTALEGDTVIPDITGLIDETAHDLLDHTGLTGIHASGSDNQTASTVAVTTTGFGGIFSNTTNYDTVQECLDAVDDHTHPVTTYVPASLTIDSSEGGDTGAYTDLSDTHANYVTINENSGASPMTVRVGFTSVTMFEQIVIRYRYAGTSGHNIAVEMYNKDTTVYDQFGVIVSTGANYQYLYLLVPDYDHYISAGAVTVRFRHIENGNATHVFYLDYVVLRNHALGSTAGDVIGPSSSVDARIAVFDGTSGKVLADGASTISDLVPKSLFDAHTVIYATTDNTPAALTVSEQTVVGRATGGNISAIAIDSDLSSVSANHDTVPSAKATKAYADLMLPLAGGTLSGDVQLGETDIKLDATLSGDEKWSGIVISGTAGSALVVGEVAFLASDGKWDKVDGILDGTDTGFSKQLGICVLAANGDTDPTEMLVYGKVRSAKFPTFTVGSPVHLADTAGELVVAQPSTTNFAIRIVGFAITAEDLLFNPSNDYIVKV